MLYFHGYCLSLINHLRPLTGTIASAGKLSPAASWCFSSNRRRSGGRGNAPDAGSDGNQDPTVKPSRGPRRRESEEREENGERRRRPSERGSQRSIQLSTISIADAEVFNYSSPSSEEKGHGDIRTRGGLHFRLDLQINLLVCCLYNIRGTDVDYGPVVHAFAIVTLNSAFFYVDKRKVESEVALYLLAQLVLSRVIHCLSICKKLAFPMRDRKYDSVEEHLEGKYKDWQKKLHPDLVHSKSEKEREYAAEQSARVIDAYRTLSKPLARAIYILKLEGVDIDEEETLSNLDLLSEIMEVREAVEEAPNSQALNQIQSLLAVEAHKGYTQQQFDEVCIEVAD